MKLFGAMKNRCSARSFLNRPVARKDLERTFSTMPVWRHRPSICQPWEYVITYGEEKDRLVKKLLRTRKERQVSCGPGTAEVLPEKYIDRSRAAAGLMHPARSGNGHGVQ